ncbi:YbhB/YbcL family Raf kinase inhibitor-like protein [Candidatus Kaiserbacteria bacterium]|nr:MAG: YbhB/YbcL family Raf kinase inhibitor-like protein [Candidatus Kaiserbacteria bacterium]
MKITSPAFENNNLIPSVYTCDGENISPELHIENVPAEAQSLVLIMEDPDVPTFVREDGMWDHWIVFNIPPETKVIREREEPKGVLGLNTGNKLGYGGPCPPDAEHRYFFMLYALDTVLDGEEGITKEAVRMLMKHHILAKAELMGRYKRIEK